jgi:hypothetical protein
MPEIVARQRKLRWMGWAGGLADCQAEECQNFVQG